MAAYPVGRPGVQDVNSLIMAVQRQDKEKGEKLAARLPLILFLPSPLPLTSLLATSPLRPSVLFNPCGGGYSQNVQSNHFMI
jgi:hypothetical protein